LNRREFLIGTAGAVVALGTPRTTSEAETVSQTVSDAKLKKGVLFGMLPGSLSIEDRFKLARDIGIEGVEVRPISDATEIKAMRAASDKTGVAIQSIMFGGWKTPLSSADAAGAQQCADELKATLQSAKELGADGVLVVPAVVNAETRYLDAYKRSQERLKPIVPVAEKLKVRILIEDVWNNFLLSPLEFARYIDELDSAYLQAYFDVGNVVAFGWPQDWIRTLGHRIKKVHLKDFKKGPREWVNLLDGDVNWPEVRKALGEVGYSGFMTAELDGGDEAYLRDLCKRMDKIIAG
jgi:L-ribulose-5-phosphate 3-epimerase